MKSKTMILTLSVILFFAVINAQKHHPHMPIDSKQPQISLKTEQGNVEILIEDPFIKRNPAEHAKNQNPKQKNQEMIPENFDTENNQKIYKPFEDENEEKSEQEQNEIDFEEFNELLKWGMLGGSAFLIYVLVRSCTIKRGRRQMRRRQHEVQQRRIMVNQPVIMGCYTQPQQPFQNIKPLQKPQEQTFLDEKILQAERQLNKLKELKQQTLRQEFNRKKIQEEQKKIQMINAQKRQILMQQRQNDWNIGYGPVFYGQQNFAYVQPEKQPFQVRGIEPIRKRSNSFKTEISEQPMLQNEIRYRNGIPIGKPVRQHDNDSSFASEYPEV